MSKKTENQLCDMVRKRVDEVVNELSVNAKKRNIDNGTCNVLNEHSINRAIQFIHNHDIACLTAFRYEFKYATENTLDDRPEEFKNMDKQQGIAKAIDKTAYKYTSNEKKMRNRDLKASLLKYGYGVTSIAGNFIENYNTPNAKEIGESSFLVVNLNNDCNFYDNIFVLSEYYNQDCFLYKPKDSDEAYSIGTNNSKWPGYNNRVPAGKLYINMKSEFLSRIGNSSFSFIPDDVKIEKDTPPYNFHTRKKQRMNSIQENVFEIYDNQSRNAKWVISNIHNENIRKINKMK